VCPQFKQHDRIPIYFLKGHLMYGRH